MGKGAGVGGVRGGTGRGRGAHGRGVTSEWPTPIHVDNQAALAMGAAGADSSRTKHIDVHCHFVRQQVMRGVTRLVYVPTNDNLADILTKPLPEPRFRMLHGLMGMA